MRHSLICLSLVLLAAGCATHQQNRPSTAAEQSGMLQSAAESATVGETEGTDTLHDGQSETLSDMSFPAPIEEARKEYLGLPQSSREFKLSAVDAEVVIIEFFNMYCPHCQREAPEVNELHKRIEEGPMAGRIKMIGVGARNSQFEVDTFRKKYKVEFPLLPDPELQRFRELGLTGTPHFLVARVEDHGARVLISHPGGFGNAEDFLHKVREEADMH